MASRNLPVRRIERKLKPAGQGFAETWKGWRSLQIANSY
jgi:hypothetical protein